MNEAIEKIALRLHTTKRTLVRVTNDNSPINCSWEALPESWKAYYRDNANWFLFDIKECGYRQIPKLTLISDEEISEIWHEYNDDDSWHGRLSRLRRIVQAQLDHDRKTTGELEG